MSTDEMRRKTDGTGQGEDETLTHNSCSHQHQHYFLRTLSQLQHLSLGIQVSDPYPSTTDKGLAFKDPKCPFNKWKQVTIFMTTFNTLFCQPRDGCPFHKYEDMKTGDSQFPEVLVALAGERTCVT
ncbi:hypothetical protein Q5P01_004892 [Channa striata]|uniref:Uncharacterized protein n=1 Tax=Channa striata TaxID=64152 RepID=A0AA88NCR4_CHASR|nr:hypothetical protein Q5P01_004892 [Channa striata]